MDWSGKIVSQIASEGREALEFMVIRLKCNFYPVSSIFLDLLEWGSSGGAVEPEDAVVAVDAIGVGSAVLALLRAWSMVLTAIGVGLTSHSVVMLHKISSDRSKAASGRVLSS